MSAKPMFLLAFCSPSLGDKPFLHAFKRAALAPAITSEIQMGKDEGRVLHLLAEPPFKLSFLQVSPNTIHSHAMTTYPCATEWERSSVESIVPSNTGALLARKQVGHLEPPESHYSGRSNYCQELNQRCVGGVRTSTCWSVPLSASLGVPVPAAARGGVLALVFLIPAPDRVLPLLL